MLNPRHIPIIGDDISKIGHVIDIFSSPCTPQAHIWVQAAFHSIPYLIIGLTKPELIDIDVPRGGRPHKKKRRFKFRFTEILQPTLVISGLPGWARYSFNTVERLGWYMLVVDATTDFAVNWTSMAYQWGGCKTPVTPWSSQSNEVVSWRHGEWFEVLWFFTADGPPGISANSQYAIVDPGVNVTWEYGLTTGRDPVQPADWDTTTVHFVVRDNLTSNILDEKTQHRDDSDYMTAGNVFKDWPFLAPGRVLKLEVMCEGPTQFGRGYNLFFNTYGRQTEGLLPDP